MSEYLHGTTPGEQDRLLRQAELLSNMVYHGVDFSGCKHILEVGAGVGAQTLQLIRRFPRLKITCLEFSEAQIKKAQSVLAEPLATGQVTIVRGSATMMDFANESFDGVFCCWILEHLNDVPEALKEVRRVLRPGSPLYFAEVFNKLWYMEPRSLMIDGFWDRLIQRQQKIGGSPFIGASMGNLLQGSGFTKIHTEFRTFLGDSRNLSERDTYLTYWKELLLSGIEVTETEKSQIATAFANCLDDKNGTLFFGFAAGSAVS